MDQFPASAEWVAFILGIIALGLAVPYILNLVYGAPSLRCIFSSIVDKDQTALFCRIYNPPITNGFWYYLGARRQPAIGVSGAVAIEECLSRSVVYRDRLLFENDDIFSMGSSQIDIPSSDTGVVAFFVKFYHRGRVAQIYPELNTELPCGTYQISLDLECDGKYWSFDRKFYLKKDESTNILTGGWENQ